MIIRHLINGSTENSILSFQFETSEIKSRELTKVGFFTNYVIQDDTPRTKETTFELGNIHVIDELTECGLGLILFIRAGKINFLEGHTFGGELWPEKIAIKEIKIIK